MAKMSDDELRTVIDAEVSDASAWSGSILAADRERNLEYYYGLPMGNEVEGRSQVVSWDVFEVIESTIPNLLEPFFAGDDIGEFEPVSQEDEPYAEQASDYVNYLIKKKNPGFLVFNTWLKDGLLSKVGIVRSWWDKTEKIKKQTYKGLTEDQLPRFVNDKSVTITAATPTPDPEDAMQREQAMAELPNMPPEQQAQVMAQLEQPAKMLYDIDVTVNMGPRGVRLSNVPPEMFVISRHAKTLEDASMLGEFRQYTRSDLVEMGYSKAKVASLSEYDMPHNMNEIALRNLDEQSDILNDVGDTSMQKLWMFFGFVRVDCNGDGIAEWRRVLMGGNEILENEEVDDHEYNIWSPILLPHRVIGMGYAEPIIEIQNIKTALTRQYLDSLYIANNPTTYAVNGSVNLDDLLSTRIGRVVRVKEPGAVGPLQTSLVANESLQGIELADTMREGRLGVTRYTQGLDADSLHKTAQGANQFLSQAQMRTKMTLRVFAETGCKDLFRRVLALTCTYQDKAATIRMRNAWVEYDPRNWSSEMDITISVGLGTSDKQADVAFLNMMAPYFMQAQPLGIVSKENVYNLGKLLLKKGDIQGADKLLTDPATVPEQEPQKSPEQTIAEAEMAIEQMRQGGKMRDAQQKAESDQTALKANTFLKTLDLQIKAKDVEIKQMELQLKEMQLNHSMNMDMSGQMQAAQPKEEGGNAMLAKMAELIERMQEASNMETHIVRDENGRAAYSVKRPPAPQFNDNEAE